MTSEAAPAIERVENLTGRRIVAGIIDVVVLAVVFIIMSALFGESESSSGDGSASFEVNLSGFPLLIFMLIFFGYYLIPEAISGQSLGKKMMGLRVIALDGSLSWGKVAIRTVLRLIDGLPFLYLVGLVCVLFNPKRQRIGDMAAGTIVTRA